MAKRARRDAHIAALEADSRAALAGASLISFAIVAHPKKRPQGGGKRPDDDGVTGACKTYRDGIADALGIDDGRFRMAPPVIAEPVKDGAIVITLTAEDAE